MILREMLVRLLLCGLVVVAGEGLVFLIEMGEAKAAPLGTNHVLGWTPRIRACQGNICLPIRLRAQPMQGKYGCEVHAETLGDFAELYLNTDRSPKVGPWEVRSSCAPVEGTDA